MLNKKAYPGEFKNLLSVLRLAVLDNRQYVTFVKKKFNYLPILQSLQVAGFIESYEHRAEIVVIKLKQTYWKSFQLPIHAFTSIDALRLNRRSTVSLKTLTKLQYRQGQVPYIGISSDKGILFGQEAVRRRIGGIPLFKIY